MTMSIWSGSTSSLGIAMTVGRRAIGPSIPVLPAYEEEQRLLDFARPDDIIVTNLGGESRSGEGL